MQPSSPEAPIKFSKEFLPQMRRVARNREPMPSGHATSQMIDRGISMENVQDVLSSSTNQVLEIQPPCAVPGKSHKDERILIFDPQYAMPLIVVCSILRLTNFFISSCLEEAIVCINITIASAHKVPIAAPFARYLGINR